MANIFIKNGVLFDPDSRTKKKTNLFVKDKKIAFIGDDPPSEVQFTIDASGCLVTPGLIDTHAHFFPCIKNGVPAESFCFPSCVTSAVDAGSTGCSTYPLMAGFLENCKVTLKCWLHVCSTGLSSLPVLENVDPDHFDVQGIAETLERHRDRIMGLKLRTSRNIVGERGYAPLKAMLRLADEFGVSVMVHCTNPPGPMDELLDMLRPGDILTHMYQNTGYTILDAKGHISQAARDARKRGVLFEAADARFHFSFKVGMVGIDEGFYPDFIGTDSTMASVFQKPTAFSMAMQLNKYISMGLSEEMAFRCCTSNAAKFLGLWEERGSLTVGKYADIAILSRVNVAETFGDRPEINKEASFLKGKITLKPVMTIKNGDFVYRDILF